MGFRREPRIDLVSSQNQRCFVAFRRLRNDLTSSGVAIVSGKLTVFVNDREAVALCHVRRRVAETAKHFYAGRVGLIPLPVHQSGRLVKYGRDQKIPAL